MKLWFWKEFEGSSAYKLDNKLSNDIPKREICYIYVPTMEFDL